MGRCNRRGTVSRHAPRHGIRHTQPAVPARSSPAARHAQHPPAAHRQQPPPCPRHAPPRPSPTRHTSHRRGGGEDGTPGPMAPAGPRARASPADRRGPETPPTHRGRTPARLRRPRIPRAPRQLPAPCTARSAAELRDHAVQLRFGVLLSRAPRRAPPRWPPSWRPLACTSVRSSVSPTVSERGPSRSPDWAAGVGWRARPTGSCVRNRRSGRLGRKHPSRGGWPRGMIFPGRRARDPLRPRCDLHADRSHRGTVAGRSCQAPGTDQHIG